MIPDAAVDVLATTWSGAVILASVQGGVALLVVWMICRIWRRLPPDVACWLWRLAYLKLVVGLLWTSPLRVHLLPPEPRVVAEAMPVVTDPVDALFAPPRLAISRDVVEPPDGRAALQVAIAPVRAAGLLGYVLLMGVVGIVWLVGVLVASVRLGVKFGVAVRLRRRARPVEDPAVIETCAALAHGMGLRRPPPVLVHDDLAGPLLVGLGRPAIVLPAPVPAAMTEDLRRVLAHELAHLRRRDLGWNLLAAVVDVLFFFHPLVWLARRDYRLRQELACDAAALRATGAAPAEYARTLIAVAARGAMPVMAFSAGVVGSRKSLERRIRAMTHLSDWSRRGRVVAGVAVVVAMVVAVPPWRVVAQDDAAKPQAAKAADATAKPETEKTVEERLKERRKAALEQESDGSPQGDLARQRALAAAGKIELLGRITAETLRLQAAADGAVEQVRVHSGDRVKRGDMLIELDGRRARAGLAQAEAKLQLAEAQVKRVQAAFDNKAAAQAEMDEKRAELQIAQAEIQLRKQDLDETRVLAPFDGMVQVMAQAGQRVNRGDVLGRLTAAGPLRAAFVIAETDVRRVVVGTPAEVRVAAFPDRVFEGRVVEVSPVVDPASGTVAASVELKGPTDGLLPGMNARIIVNPVDQAKPAR